MKRKVKAAKLQKFIITSYNNPDKRSLLIKSLNERTKCNKYKHEDLMRALYKTLNTLIQKVVFNQPITEIEKEFIEDSFIILSRATTMHNKEKNLAVLMDTYFTKYPAEKVNNYKNRNLTFLNVITSIVSSNKVGSLYVRLHTNPMIYENKEISGTATSKPNHYLIDMYEITDKMFDDEELFYSKIYDFLHEFGHVLQYRKRTDFSKTKTELFNMENRILQEDYEMYDKYYHGFELEYEANCIAKELIDNLFDNNPQALEIANKLFEDDKNIYEKSLDDFLGYIKRTYSFKLKRD